MKSWLTKKIGGVFEFKKLGFNIKNKISQFIKKYHGSLVAIFIPLISIFLAYLFWNILLRISSARFLWTLLVYTSTLILTYIYLSYINKTDWINKHQSFITIISILIPIILFCWQQATDKTSTYLKYEISLIEENNRNISHLQSITNDLKNNSRTVFWRDFSTDKYKQYWDYIYLNYSQDCKNLYANLTIQLDVLNKINQIRRELMLVTNNLHEQMLHAASTTQPIFNNIISKCQNNLKNI